MLFLFLNLLNSSPARAALSIVGKRCGTKVCLLNEYCSTYHGQCESCETACEEGSHNFDQDLCTTNCQDYLHDIRYAKTNSYSADLKQLQKQQTLILIITIVMLIIFLIIHGIHFVRWAKRNDYLSFKCFKKLSKKSQKKEQPQADYTHENPHTHSPKLQIRANNNINGRDSTVFSVTGTEAQTVKTVSTPLSRRHPAEDSIENYSYDNGGLVVTPVSEKPKGNETAF